MSKKSYVVVALGIIIGICVLIIFTTLIRPLRPYSSLSDLYSYSAREEANPAKDVEPPPQKYSERMSDMERSLAKKPAAKKGVKPASTAMPSEAWAKAGGEAAQRTRMVIMNADLRLEVAKYDEAFASVKKITEQNQGYIVSSEVNAGDSGKKSGHIVLRIPSKKFDIALEEFKKLASRVDRENLKGNDVTEEFYDVSARLENKRKAEKRYQEILRTAKNTREIMEVEESLMAIRENIERLEGRVRYLKDQVELSTIDIYLYEPKALSSSAWRDFWQKIKSGFNNGVSGFAVLIAMIITLIITLIPVVPIVILSIYARRYIKKRRAAKAVPTELSSSTPESKS